MFKPHYHIPKFSFILLKSLKSPILGYFTVVGNMIMCLSAYVFYLSERDLNNTVSTYWDALWWAMCTVSTVGYGDIVPITGIGRITGAFLIIIGVMFFLGFTAVLASIMTTFIREEKKQE